MILGGDHPWTKRAIGVSTCPQVGSMFNEGIWDALKKGLGGGDIPPTRAADEARCGGFILWAPSWQAANCIMCPILCLARASVCLVHFRLDHGYGSLARGVC